MQAILILYLAVLAWASAQTSPDAAPYTIAGTEIDASVMAPIIAELVAGAAQDSIGGAGPSPGPGPAGGPQAATAANPDLSYAAVVAAPAAGAANITYQPARCGPWFGGQACPPDGQNRQLFCSRWGYCGWEFQPQEQAGKFLHPDLLCSSDKECTDAVANSGLKDVVCSPNEHKCLITITAELETSTPAQTVSGDSMQKPAAFVLGLMLALGVFL